MPDTIVVALISVFGSIVVAIISYFANRKGAKEASKANAELIAYRLQQLEEKQDRHNAVIERTYILEGRMTEVEHDIRDMRTQINNRAAVG